MANRAHSKNLNFFHSKKNYTKLNATQNLVQMPGKIANAKLLAWFFYEKQSGRLSPSHSLNGSMCIIISLLFVMIPTFSLFPILAAPVTFIIRTDDVISSQAPIWHSPRLSSLLHKSTRRCQRSSKSSYIVCMYIVWRCTVF